MRSAGGPPTPARGWRRALAAALVALLGPVAGLVGAASPAVAVPGPSAAAAGRAPAELVRVAVLADVGPLVPYVAGGRWDYPLLTLVYDTLMWRDGEGRPQPWLARSVETSQDGRRVTIRLRSGARWHDGLPVTAEDVALTFDVAARWPHFRFRPQLEAVERVDVADRETVVVTLRHPSPGFLDQPLAELPIVPAHLWRGAEPGGPGPAGPPVGSGPYRLAAYEPGARYRFEAVADYYRGAPAVTTLEVVVVPPDWDAERIVDRSDVDMLRVVSRTAFLSRSRDPRLRELDGPSYESTALLFNVRRPPFDDPAARRALGAALDLTRVARAADRAAPATGGPLHPESPWAPPAAPAPSRPGRAPAALRRLPPFELLVHGGSLLEEAAATSVARQLQGAGVRVTVRELDAGELAVALGTGDFGVAVWGLPALPSYDPDFLRALFGSDPRVATMNLSGYASAAFDAAMDRVATTADEAGRRAAVADALRVLAEDAPVVPLFFEHARHVYRYSAYEGWRFVKGTGVLDKQSFTDPAPPRVPLRAPPDPDPMADPSWSLLGWAALGLACASVVTAAAALLRR